MFFQNGQQLVVQTDVRIDSENVRSEVVNNTNPKEDGKPMNGFSSWLEKSTKG